MEALRAKKEELLFAQKERADRFHELLTGLNEASRKTCKNLEAAITASKKPGYFLYYEQPDVAKAIVKNGELRKLQSAIVQLQQKIDQVDAEIEVQAAKSSAPAPAEVQTLKQWFSTYGTPKPVTSGVLTSFAADPKVYGGTEHYSAFKSQSLTMKKGRLTK
ncbi:hypothetical protein SPRG_02329 [Saprolegnia parasitica CBS 223.65]|uniref:Uncharacterized protein n=1 Tax=Saprolegnia parasitica (strain CBS 223.65) TaxID=695850 RepID=A0A067CQ53_SAPPC|nr:hypothetical protein SPRG_02329 [Saprolegnia parasitica CBS 223.65]KDO32628.1 hypothetical protein SPRG_02329 [Saprolegnia parasitica CBS 223.65]|eukprot:XP_012196296.1 hypothetical protein SPRG_02329 [Saprolegnia parasitica CBS 223.65]